jgi:hypothetical protein
MYSRKLFASLRFLPIDSKQYRGLVVLVPDPDPDPVMIPADDLLLICPVFSASNTYFWRARTDTL